MRHAVYSVITPEGCAAILWKDSNQSQQAAEALKLTSEDLFKLKIIDEIVVEPSGGAHTSLVETANLLDESLIRSLHKVRKLTHVERLAIRYQKLRSLGI